MKPSPYTRTDMEDECLGRAFSARLEVARLHGEKLVEEYQFKCAEALLAAGLTLIPSEHLRDHEFVVSRGVYSAAQKLISGK